MVSYDYLYEDVTIKDVQYNLKFNNDWKIELSNEKELLLSDLELVSSDQAKKILTKEINEIQIQINRHQKEFDGWNKVKRRIENGENFTYQSAISIVRGY